MPSSRASSRNDLVEVSVCRISVSLCCTSGWLTTVTPFIVSLDSKYRAVTDDLQRRSAVGTLLLCDVASGCPGAALQDAGERQRLAVHIELGADRVGEAVEQRHGERAPFDHQLGVDRVLALRCCRIAQGQRAGVDEQSAVAILSETR